MKRAICLLALTIIMYGCATAPKDTQPKQVGNINSSIIKDDLNGMSDEQIQAYANQCISNNVFFLYRGGYTGWYLVDESDMEFAKTFKWVGIGCIGGVEEGYKFNKLMLEHVKNKTETKK